MKVKALAKLSGKTGDRQKDEEFTVGAAHGRELVERGLVVEVETAPARTGQAKRSVGTPKAKPAPEAPVAAE